MLADYEAGLERVKQDQQFKTDTGPWVGCPGSSAKCFSIATGDANGIGLQAYGTQSLTITMEIFLGSGQFYGGSGPFEAV